MRGFPVNGDPKPAELSRPPERPPPELGYRCAQGRRLDLVDNCFWYLGDIGALANVRFAPQKQPFPLRDRRHTGAALHSERFRSDCILGHRAISLSGGRPSGKSNASKRFRIAADLGSGTDCSIPSCQMVTLENGPTEAPASRARTSGRRSSPRAAANVKKFRGENEVISPSPTAI